ncbi:hypothetical protein E3H11_25705 [Bradyrhizobium brasilense]|uniref:hypothetical protein n=1 Tax=Bradyrhizobium brasilense TaxID=1419277 RepID=UPI00145773F1|nr:hypothetical protein [Bradyrhizobium brasilense]NLS72230.1 hypothetical protein [Bradyrhizobium brasilense]
MKRKVAAILAADIAGQSRLVADDEEETLRRLASTSPLLRGRPERTTCKYVKQLAARIVHK